MLKLCFTVNRRLDEWVTMTRFDLNNKLEDHCKIKDVSITMTDLTDDRKITRNQKRKHDEINHVQKVIPAFYINLQNNKKKHLNIHVMLEQLWNLCQMI